jgi:hypothetical protein
MNKMMIKNSLLMVGLLICFITKAQPVRYFQFKTNCGHGNWQDSSFVAAASDAVLIDTVMANLNRPISQRKFINGKITGGDGGFNSNANHWFKWHFIPDQWDLVELAMEVCDGCPYTDLDADTAYWIGNIGRFCPWSGIPVKEVSGPLLTPGQIAGQADINIFPNPASSVLHINCDNSLLGTVEIYNSAGVVCMLSQLSGQKMAINLSRLRAGLYFVKINRGNKGLWTDKLVITD